MDKIRPRRVAELLKNEISQILTNDVDDPRVQDVVITHVKVTADLSIARIYYSSYDKKSFKDLEIGIDKSKNFIRRKLMTSVHMRKLPQLVFERDNIPEEAERLDEILRQIGSVNDEQR